MLNLKLLLVFVSAFGLSHSVCAQPLMAEKIDQYLRTNLEKSSLPGLAVAVVHGDSVLLAKGYGLTGAKQPVTANTPFAIASLSKAFTAMCIVQLAEARQLDLDAPIVRYIPTFSIADPRGSAITIRQLLHQSSGLADTGFPELAFTEQPPTLDAAIARLKTARLASDPGEKFHYHNPNFQILAKVVEAVSHEPYPSYLEKHILRPLNMTHTHDVPLTDLLYPGDKGVEQGHIFCLGQPIAWQEPDWFIEGAAGMSASVNDLANWLILQLNQGTFKGTQLLSQPSMSMMHHPAPNPVSSYGMAWFVNENGDLSHNGTLWTYSAEQLVLTKKGYGIVVLFNGGLNPFVDYYSFLRGVADIVEGKEPERPTVPDWLYPVAISVALLVGTGFAVRRLSRLKYWQQAYEQRPIWRSWLYLFLRLLPICLFLLIPYLVPLLSGRVLNWPRIFLMMPDVIAGWGLLAVVHLLVVVTRVFSKLKAS